MTIVTAVEALEALASARGLEVRTPAWLGDDPVERVELFRKGVRRRSLLVFCFTDGRALPFEVDVPDHRGSLRRFARASEVLAEFTRLERTDKQ